MDNTIYWNKFNKPPQTALKNITGGRLKGKTDINPQWRLKVMTQVFGPCGIGWYYDINKLWTEQGQNNEVMAFAEIRLYIKSENEWSKGVAGVGGSMLIAKERDGMYNSDEAYKMAVTDALSVAMKCLGVASEIYEGNYDGSKYINEPVEYLGKEQLLQLCNINRGLLESLVKHRGYTGLDAIPKDQYKSIEKWLIEETRNKSNNKSNKE